MAIKRYFPYEKHNECGKLVVLTDDPAGCYVRIDDLRSLIEALIPTGERIGQIPEFIAHDAALAELRALVGGEHDKP